MCETSLRHKIHNLVCSLTAFDTIEYEHIQFVLQWLKSGCEIFRTKKPATPNTHLVSYFVVISPKMDQILLVDHKKAALWLPPGGHVDPGEDPKETVKREAREELDIEADFVLEKPLFITVTKTNGNSSQHTDVSLWYLIKLDPNTVLHFDCDEFNAIKWFYLDKVPFHQSDPHIKRFIHKLNLLFSNVNSAANSI